MTPDALSRLTVDFVIVGTDDEQSVGLRHFFTAISPFCSDTAVSVYVPVEVAVDLRDMLCGPFLHMLG
jgi:hypothetical protein